MKKIKNSKKFLIGFCVLFATLVCSASVTAAAIVGNNSITIHPNENFKEDETVIINELQQKDIEKLIDEVNKLDFFTAEEKIICYYDVIRSKLKDAPIEDITVELLDNKNTDDVRINLLLLCDLEGIKLDYADLLQMLDDENISPSVKNVLIDLMGSEGEKYIDEIEAFVLSYNESSIIEALSTLQSLNPKKAENIANDILSDLTGTFSEKYKAALITKAASLYTKSSQKETKEFIDICNNVINNMPTDDEDEKEISVIYALSSIQNIDCLSYLMNIESEKAISFRAYIVDENQSVINDILKEAPNTENVELLAKISPYYVPQKDIIDKINKYLYSNDEYFEKNPDQKNMLLEVGK